ncbi:MAG: YggS family pyridoxal phosphate enzyme [Candidatus Melainabacteria bacterium RIFOXYA12_FULL_32_12]|nr:MAG: YggS family pyridoxal phosphate enzyme [Candidatus Melainabacteria bacterium RIFOXYA2_FULL_32_9]OGI26776.1 MAG: YggS family pyridoxal phosphate enzyme [Candidatus Melainabacteria bacterium RIFOXYA12_FULL_32_12]
MSKIPENLQVIKNKINTEKVRIIAVTKYVSVNEILELYKAGIRNIGENKIQDAENKKQILPENIEKDINWHFIGHLQTNKVKKVVGNFEYIHSVDSEKLVKAVSESAKAKNITQNILIQVNIAEEETKYGFDVNAVKEVFPEILKFDAVNVVGLMTMAPYTLDEKLLHTVFRTLRELRDYLEEKYNCKLPELSMGMSNDYQIAAEEGATMIRLGRVLFE